MKFISLKIKIGSIFKILWQETSKTLSDYDQNLLCVIYHSLFSNPEQNSGDLEVEMRKQTTHTITTVVKVAKQAQFWNFFR